MKKRIIFFTLFLMFDFITAARADMIETKAQGIKNGTIVSENADEVVFKDADGNKSKFPRKDVLYLMREDKAAATPGSNGLLDMFTKKSTDAPPKAALPAKAATTQTLAGRLDAGERMDAMQRQADAAYNTSDATRGERAVLARMTGRAVGDAQPPANNWRNSAQSQSSYSSSSQSSSSGSSGSGSSSSGDYHSLSKDGKESNFHSL